jgi:hypothetical protein
MFKEITIEKTKILQYLEFTQDEVDLMNFAKWLEANSSGLFHINKGLRPKERNNYLIK